MEHPERVREPGTDRIRPERAGPGRNKAMMRRVSCYRRDNKDVWVPTDRVINEHLYHVLTNDVEAMLLVYLLSKFIPSRDAQRT